MKRKKTLLGDAVARKMLGDLRGKSDPTKAIDAILGEPMSGAQAVSAMTGGRWPVQSELDYRVNAARLALQQAKELYYERHQQYLDALKAAGKVEP